MDQASNFFQFIRPGGIVTALVVLALAWILIRLLARPMDRLATRFPQWRLKINQAMSIVRLLVYLGAIAASFSLVFEFSDQALFALGGTFAVAVGISLKDLASSIIAGVTIIIDKPFQVGDRVTYAGVYGEVVAIGLRTVRLVTLDDNLVTVPNNKFLTDVVASGNAGALDMLVQMDFFIGLEQDLSKAKRIVSESLVASRFAYLKKPWKISVKQVVMDNLVALRLRAKVYVLDIQYEKALETDVTERVTEAFREADVRPPAILHRSDVRQTHPDPNHGERQAA